MKQRLKERLRVRAWRTAADAGFTLAEMLVVIVITGIIVSAVAALCITGVKTTETTQTTLSQINDGRVAMETMTRLIRTAVVPASLASCPASGCPASQDAAFFTASDGTPVGSSRIALYADIDNPDGSNAIGPSQVTFTVETTGDLVETIQPPDSSSGIGGYQWTPCAPGAPGCSMRTYTLTAGVATTAGPVFTYYVTDSSGTQTKQASISASDYPNIDAVDISLTVKHSGGAGAATTFDQRVSLSNVDTYLQCPTGSC